MIRLFPLLILVSLFSFVVRFGDIVTKVKTPSQALSASVVASDGKSSDEKKEASVEIPSGLPENENVTMPKDDWADPATLDMEFSKTQTLVLKELKERRESLDSRELRANQHEALLKVTERRIGEKIAELAELRKEIEGLLGVQSKEEELRLQSLVKIYSGMKPKSAASIFNNLDMKILLNVIGRMSERKSSPILAAMDTKKVQELTILLAEQRSLPDF